MNKTKCKNKDAILKFLDGDKLISLKDDEIAVKLNLDIFDVAYLLEELEKEELVELTEITSLDTYRKAYMVILSNRGKYFYKYEGFQNRYKDYKREKIWKTVKITAAVLNAIAILIIAGWNLYLMICK